MLHTHSQPNLLGFPGSVSRVPRAAAPPTLESACLECGAIGGEGGGGKEKRGEVILVVAYE